MSNSRWVWLLGCLLAAGCGSDAAGPRGGADGASGAATYHGALRAVIETRCVGCHSAGNIGSFSMAMEDTTFIDGAPSWAAAAVSAVESRSMPPWMPDGTCRDLEGSRRLADEEIALFRAWRDAGYPEGDVGDYAPPEAQDRLLPEATLSLAPRAAYTPNAALSDDYRCFVLPHTFETESYVFATSIAPGVRDQVHHVILYAVDNERVAEAEALDAAEPGEGYTCFAGSGVGGASNIGGWAPGSVPMQTPADSARVLKAGSRIVMQVHYNNDHVAPDWQPSADLTSTQLWLLPEGEKPRYRIRSMPLANFAIEILPGDGDSVHTRAFGAPGAGTIVGVLPHMHTLGKRIEVTLKRASGDACLSRIPRWDFHWQQGYRFTDEAFVPLEPGDQLELTCAYDNTNGTETVRWGEGTRDEMCLAYIELQTELTESRKLADECPSYPGCLAACADGDVRCIARCGAASSACSACISPALGKCAVGRCSEEGLALQACTSECAGDGGCVSSTCALPIGTFFACMEPALRDGSCDADLASCGD